MNGIEIITTEALKALKENNLELASLKDILPEGNRTRQMLQAASQSDLSDEIKMLCDEKKYILFDNDMHGMTLKVIAVDKLDSTLKTLLTKYEGDILRMVAVDRAHMKHNIELHSTEYYEPFICFVQSYILNGPVTNWYIEMSDYIIDFLYNWFEEDTINKYVAAHMKNREEILPERKKVEEAYENLTKKIDDIINISTTNAFVEVMQVLEKSIDGMKSDKVLNHSDFLRAMDNIQTFLATTGSNIGGKKISLLVMKFRDGENTRCSCADDMSTNMELMDKSIKVGLKLRKHLYKKLHKMLNKQYLNKETTVFIGTGVGEDVETIKFNIDSIIVAKETVELQNKEGDMWSVLKSHLDNESCKDLARPHPVYQSPVWKSTIVAFHDSDFKEIKCGLHETDYVLINNETGEPVEGLDAIYGIEALNTGEVKGDDIASLIPMTKLPVELQKRYIDFFYENLEDYDESNKKTISNVEHDRKLEKELDDIAKQEAEVIEEREKFTGTYKQLIKTYCEVCGDAWVGTLARVNYPHYACMTCRENDKSITFGNSIEFDNAEEYGN